MRLSEAYLAARREAEAFAEQRRRPPAPDPPSAEPHPLVIDPEIAAELAAEVARLAQEIQQSPKETDMQNNDLGALNEAEVNLIKQARARMSADEQAKLDGLRQREQETAAGRARFDKLMRQNAGSWSKEDLAFVGNCMPDLLQGKIPFSS
jgi:hypothetical protein